MTRRMQSTAPICALAAAAVGASAAAEIVELRVQSRFLSAPATVRFTVVVEPDATNRMLRVETDSETMSRASELTLEGAAEKRLHEIQFSGMPAGRYSLRATVLSADGVRGTARDLIEVVGTPQR